jgi:hypothetical protein
MSEESAMGKQMSFEGLEIGIQAIKLKAAWVNGLGSLKVGDRVRIEGVATVIGVGFEREKKTDIGMRVHTIAADRIVATETVTDADIEALGF